MSFQIDVYTYISKPLIGAGFLTLYNYFMQNETNKSILMYDAFAIGASFLTANLVKDLIYDFFGFSDSNGVQYMILEPPLVSILYSYAYNSYLKNKFRSLLTNRDDMTNYSISAIITILTDFSVNPLISLFMGINYY